MRTLSGVFLPTMPLSYSNATVAVDPPLLLPIMPSVPRPDLRHCGSYLWPIHSAPITQHASAPFISSSFPELPLAHFCLFTSVILLTLL